eukprot:scaffold928_cov370-Prasinococcus_capsulatus_cf.AAC.19
MTGVLGLRPRKYVPESQCLVPSPRHDGLPVWADRQSRAAMPVNRVPCAASKPEHTRERRQFGH